MGTVQAYIQGLEQGSINKNCDFIDIRATGTTWDSGEQALERTVTYIALTGKYYTTLTKITGAILGAAAKNLTIAIYEGLTVFALAKCFSEVIWEFYGLATFVLGIPSAPEYILISPTDSAKVISAFLSSDLLSILKNVNGILAKGGLGKGIETLLGTALGAPYGPFVFLMLKASFVGLICATIAYILCKYGGLSPQLTQGITWATYFITTGVVTAICLAKGWWIAANVAAALGPIGWIVAIIFIAAGLIILYFTLR
jgi:hypothetical protein